MSLVNSTIDDYVLASFALPAAKAPSLVPPPPVAAVEYPNNPRQDGRLVMATPGVGVSIYDLADQTPLSSITVGPSFAPTTAAVARSVPLTSSESIRVKSTRQTWVGVRTDEGKGEIWCWQEEERKDGSSESEAGKAVWPISEPLAALAVPRTLPSHLVFLSKSGSFALAPSADLTSLVSLPYDDSASKPKPSSQTFRVIPVNAATAPAFLPASISSHLPAKSQAHVAIIVRTFDSSDELSAEAGTASLTEIGKKKFKKTPRPSSSAVIDAADSTKTGSRRTGNEVELVLLDPEVQAADATEAKAGVVSLGRIAVAADKVVVSDDGFVTSLSVDGTLSSSRLAVNAPTYESYSEIFFPSTVEDVVPPTLSLSPVKTVHLSTTALVPSQAVLCALHSSFVLVVAPRASNDGSAPVASLTFWDTRFGAVVASSDLNVPSAVASSTATLSLSACLPNRNTAVVTLSPSTSAPISPSSRIALFCLPLSPPLPSSSVLAAIVGRQRLTARYLAASEASHSVVAQARRAEPIASSALAADEQELVEQSRQARHALLETLEKALRPLRDGKHVSEADMAVQVAEREWAAFLEQERARTESVERPKLVKRRKEAVERKVDELRMSWNEGDVEGANGRWKRVKRSIDKAIAAEGERVEVGTGESGWKAVVKKDVAYVEAEDRATYEQARNKVEKRIERLRAQAESVADERVEPKLPSAFVTALLRLSFPVPLDAPSTDLGSSSTIATPSTWRHPTQIVAYLLERGLVSESQLEGGVSRYLARAGDWSNVLLAFSRVPDIPESTAVAILLSALRQPTSADADMDIDSSPASLPSPVPSLFILLSAFLEQSYTSSALRQALQKQMSAIEALIVLEVCDSWLGWWLQGLGSVDGSQNKAPEGDSTQLVIVDPFRSQRSSDVPPTPDQVVPIVQAILDAHFVTLLLQRQSHKLLRRLTSHVATHTAQMNDLSTLLGALSVFSRKNDELVRADDEVKRRAEARRNGVVEEKKYGESMDRRARAQEKHQEVGAYQVEEFFL
ncbi:hypothetical protein JCM10212_005551 [Sporobolomyces blumeae]